MRNMGKGREKTKERRLEEGRGWAHHGSGFRWVNESTQVGKRGGNRAVSERGRAGEYDARREGFKWG